jgi:antitoxin HigA-1
LGGISRAGGHVAAAAVRLQKCEAGEGRSRQGQSSIRIKDPYRVCFGWKDADGNSYFNCLAHPVETILEDVLKPLGMSVNQLATDLGVTATRLNDIVRGRRGVTADTALRLARYLGTSAEFWLGLQLEYDLRMARQAKQKEIERAVRPRSEAA